MENRRAGEARGGGPAGDSSSDEDIAPPMKVLTQEEQWHKVNWHSPANADRPRTPAEKTAAAEKKFNEVKSFLRSHGVSELEFQRVFELPIEKQRQGPVIDGYHRDALVVCADLAMLRRSYLQKYHQKESKQTKGEIRFILEDIESHELALQKLRAKVTKAKGKAIDWPEVFKTPVTKSGGKKK